MARRVGRHRHVAVDRVAADEVARVHHAVRVRARRLAVDLEAAEHGRRRRLARGDVVDPLDLAAAADQRHHLPGQVGLDVVAVLGVADLELAAPVEDAAHDRLDGLYVRAIPRHLAPGHHRARGRVVVDPATRGRRSAASRGPSAAAARRPRRCRRSA